MASINEVSTGIKFYGMDAVDYTLSSEPGTVIDFETLLRKVAIDRSLKIEAEVAQLSVAVKERQKLVDMLGKALSFTNFVTTDLVKESYSKEREYTFRTGDSHFDAFLAYSQVGYCMGVDMRYTMLSHEETAGGQQEYKIKISRENACKDQNSVQYFLDMQNNLLQQEMIAVESLFNKQSDAFTTAKKLASKVSSTRKNTIQGIS